MAAPTPYLPVASGVKLQGKRTYKGLVLGKLTFKSARGVLEFIERGGALAPQQLIVNRLGFGDELHRYQRLYEALDDPKAYMKARYDEMKELAEESGNLYQKEVVNLSDIGTPRQNAEDFAYAATKAMTDLQMTYINVDYPTNIIVDSLQLLGAESDKRANITAASLIGSKP